MSDKQALSGRPRNRLPFAPEGWPFMGGALTLVVAAAALCWWIPAALFAVLFALVVNFFRDPERDTPSGEGLFVAPADGKVVRAGADDAGRPRVDIFMNIFDVHVNRAPMGGRITDMRYYPGRFVNASFDKASVENERNRFEMETDDGGHSAFTQIAGLVARRIVSYVAVGDRVAAGERIGMIRFGSRVDCEIPEGFEIRVAVGDRVKAGETVLASRAGGEA